MVTLRFTPTVADGDRLYIDLAQCLSIVNRRFTKQFQNFTVRGGAIHDSNQNAYVKFNTACDNWATRRALRRGRDLYNMQFAEILKMQPGLKPKYHDYKVFLLAAHYQAGSAANLTPVDSQENFGAVAGAGRPYDIGQWNYSQYVTEDVDWNVIATAGAGQPSNRNADQFYAHIVGDHSGNSQNWFSVGLIRSWSESTGYQPSSVPVVDATDAPIDPLANLFDEADADDEKILLLDADGDRPPYHVQATPGSENLGLHRQAFAATSSGAGSISYFNGFQALCGLIELDFTVTQSGIVEILLDVEPTGAKI